MIAAPPSPAIAATPVPRSKLGATLFYFALALVAIVWAAKGISIEPARAAKGLPQAQRIVALMFGPPDFSPSVRDSIIEGLRQSVQIAALGTAIAAVLALPFGALAARNLTRLAALPYVGKTLLNLIRAFPDIVLALMFVRALGPGPFAGVLAVGIHSIGMMGKLYAERIETTDKGAREALLAGGATPFQAFRLGVVPEVLPDFLSFTLYRFDLNVRAATILGIVGAGGIGQPLILNQSGGNWPAVGAIVICIIATVGLVDYISGKLRARLT